MHETPAKSQEALRRIVFCGKLAQCVTDSRTISLRFPGRKTSSRQKKTAGSAAGSTSAHPKEELHAEMRSFCRFQVRFAPLSRGRSIRIIGIAN